MTFRDPSLPVSLTVAAVLMASSAALRIWVFDRAAHQEAAHRDPNPRGAKPVQLHKPPVRHVETSDTALSNQREDGLPSLRTGLISISRNVFEAARRSEGEMVIPGFPYPLLKSGFTRGFNVHPELSRITAEDLNDEVPVNRLYSTGQWHITSANVACLVVINKGNATARHIVLDLKGFEDVGGVQIVEASDVATLHELIGGSSKEVRVTLSDLQPGSGEIVPLMAYYDFSKHGSEGTEEYSGFTFTAGWSHH